MPHLHWSTRAQAVTSADQRRQMSALFDAYFRVGAPPPTGTVLLDPRLQVTSNYYFVAEFLPGRGWEADARISRPDLHIVFREGCPSL